MKRVKVTFRQKVEEKEIAERQVNEAFNILFTEVIKRIKEGKITYSFNLIVIREGGDMVWGN